MSTSRSRSVRVASSGSVYSAATSDCCLPGPSWVTPVSIIFSMSRFVAVGAMMALPWCTVRIELSSVSGSVSLSRKPEAPALIADMTYSSRSKVVRMITRVCCSPSACDVICAVAANPSILGIRTSMSTMSGWSRSTSCTACVPSEACPTTCMSGCELITMVNPARTSS